MNTCFNIGDLIGNTPLINFEKTDKFEILAKCEFLNPSGSIKDRSIFAMIEHALKSEIINENSTIFEAATKASGISLAMICANLKLKLVLVVPEDMPKDVISVFKAYGANVVFTPSEDGLLGSIKECKNLKKHTPNSYFLDQFNNPLNPLSQESTALEVIQKITELDYFVTGFETGGAISGMSKVLKNSFLNLKVIAVEVKNSKNVDMLNNLNKDLIDESIVLEFDEVLETTKKLAKSGLLVGLSSGINICASKKIANEFGGRILTLLPDRLENVL